MSNPMMIAKNQERSNQGNSNSAKPSVQEKPSTLSSQPPKKDEKLVKKPAAPKKFKPKKLTNTKNQELLTKFSDLVPMTSKSSFRKSTTFANEKYIANLCTVDHALAKPRDFSSVTGAVPAAFNGYLQWAALSFHRRNGALSMPTVTDNFAFPDFPEEAYLPNAMWFLLEYLNPYEEGGVKAELQVVPSALPTGNDDSISNAGTGTMSLAAVAGLTCFQTAIATESAVLTAGSAASHTLLSVSNNWQLYSQIIQGRGCCRKYGDLGRVAPDASAYALYQSTVPHMIYSIFKKFRGDMGIVCSEAGSASNAQTNAVMFKDCPPIVDAYDGGWSTALDSCTYVRQCFVYYANRHDYVSTVRKFTPYWNARRMSTFIAVQRQWDLKGFHMLQTEFLKYYLNSITSSMTANNVFGFLFLTELAVVAKAYCSSPMIFGRIPITSGQYLDQKLSFLPESCSIKIPALFADYAQCLGTTLDESGQPYFLTPKLVDNATTWITLSNTSQATLESTANCIVSPNAAWGSAINFSAGGNVWNAAFIASITGAPWYYPQRCIGDIARPIYGTAAGLQGTDVFINPDSRTCFGGVCTQAVVYMVAETMPAVAQLSTSGTVITTTTRQRAITLNSTYPLVGSELLRAFLYAFRTTTSVALNAVGRYNLVPPSDTAVQTLYDMLLQSTVQPNGSFQLELADLHAKAQKETKFVPGVGSFQTGKAKGDVGIMDRIMSEFSQFLGQSLERAADATVKVGKKAIPILGKMGLDLVKKALGGVLGAAVFAM